MRYKNAREILPDRLFRELQRYAAGDTLYIPEADEKKDWGAVSGAKTYYAARNRCIRTRHAQGQTIAALAEDYSLSPDAIRKILKPQK